MCGILVLYNYIADKKTTVKPNKEILDNVLINNLIAEILLISAWFYEFPMATQFCMYRLAGFYIAQDLYFYLVHKYIFHRWLWNIHNKHHSQLSAYAAWYAHPVEFIFLNLGSIAVPYYIFNNNLLTFVLIVVQQIYTSVNGHTEKSPHSVHHDMPNLRFGSIYLFDRLAGTYAVA